MNLQKKKNNNFLWILLVIILLATAGFGIYYFVWRDTKEEKNQTFEEKLQQIHSQLAEIKTVLNKPENASKKVQYSTQIADLENQVNNLPSQNTSQQEEIISQLQGKIKEICRDLGIKEPEPDPSPDPPDRRDWPAKKSDLVSQAITKLFGEGKRGEYLWIGKDDWTKPWNDELDKASSEAEFNIIKKEALKDVAELKLASSPERLKLKDYFIFNLGYEIGTQHIDDCWNVRNIGILDKVPTVADLNKVIKTNHPKPTWQRKYIAFIGGFNINSKEDGEKLDRLIESDEGKDTWIVIKKTHNSTQYNTERNTFYLRKGEPDYHEFKSRKEAINWLRQNDSYFE